MVLALAAFAGKIHRNMGQFFCGLRGHEHILKTDKGKDSSRVYLTCMSCGYVSSGWELEHRNLRYFKSLN